jgi:hypothetical protein
VSRLSRFRPVWATAIATGRPERTIRTWVWQLRVTSACDLRTRALLVDVVEAARISEAAARRNRAA